MANERQDDDVKYNTGQCRKKRKINTAGTTICSAPGVEQYLKIFIMVEEEKRRKAGECGKSYKLAQDISTIFL